MSDIARAGSADVLIFADFTPLKRQVAAEMNRLGRENIHVGVDVDTRGLRGFEGTIKKVRAETKDDIVQTLAGDFETGGFQEFVGERDKVYRETQARRIEQDLGFKVDEGSIAKALGEVKAARAKADQAAGIDEVIRLRLGAEADNASIAAVKKEVEAKVGAIHVDPIEVETEFDLDDVSRARVKTAIEDIDHEARGIRRIKAEFNVDTSTARSAFRSLNRENIKTQRNLDGTTRAAHGTTGAFGSLGKAASGAFGRTFKFSTRIPIVGLTAMGTVAYNAAGGLIALAGALAPLSGLLGAVGPLALSAAQGIGTIKLATSGVSDAISAAFTQQDKAAVSSTASLKQQTASVEAVREAHLSLTAAERTAKFAQEDLTQARSDATRQIEDMRAAVKQLALDEEGASLSLKEAKKALRDLVAQGAGDLEIERASLRIREARAELQKTRTESKRTRDDLGKAEAGGVKGMPQVVQAKRSLADANRGVAEAERELTNALKQSTEAMGGGGAAADAFAQKLAKLPPAAQSFVKFIVGLRPEIKKLQGIAAQGLFPGVEQGIRAATVNLPVLEKIVGRTSKAFGDLAKQAGKRLGSAEWGKDLEVQGARNEVTIRRLGAAGLNLAEAFKDVSLAAGPLVDRLTKWVGVLTEGWKESAKSAEGQRKLTAFFKDAGDTFFKTKNILADLAVSFKNIGSAARQAFGNELLGNIALGAKNLREWTASAEGQRELVAIFKDVGENLKKAGRFVRDLVGDFRDLKAEGKTTGEALGDIFVDIVAGAAAKVFNSAPRIAEALVKGFLQADIWGKVIGGAFLISRFGGVGAWKAIGAKLGLGLGAGVSEGAAAGIVGGGAAGAGAAGGLTGALSKLSPKMRAIGKGVLGAALVGGLGAAFTDSRKSLIDRFRDVASFVTLGILPKSKEISERLQEAIKQALTASTKASGGTLSVTVDKLLEGIGKDLPARETKILNRFKNLRVRAAAILGKDFKLDWFKGDTTVREVNRIIDSFGKLKHNTLVSMAAISRETEENAKRIRHSLGANTKAGREALEKNMQLSRHAIEDSLRRGWISGDQALKALLRSFRVNSKGSKDVATRNFGEAKDAILGAISAGRVGADRGLKAINKLFLQYLAGFGIKGAAARFFIKEGPRGAGFIPGSDKSPMSGHKVQTGGVITVPGTGTGDKVAARVPVGTGVINRKAANVLLEPGEKLVPPKVVKKMGGPKAIHAINRAVPRFQQGGVLGDEKPYRRGGIIDLLRALPGLARGGIAGMVAAANRLEKAHFPYVWGGGHQASPAPFGPMDCSGAVSFVLQQAGVKIPTMVSGALATAGKAGAGRNATVFANAGHTFMRIGRRYFGTSGQNPGGGAGWFEDPGADYRSGFAQRHFGVGDVDVPKIPRMEVDGPDSALKAGVQSGLDATRNAAQRALRRAASSLGAPIGSGDPVPAGEFSRGDLTRLWRRAGGSSGTASIAAAIAMAESGGRSDATNSNTDGSIDRGLWQINSIHGGLSTFDPLANARAAVEISSGGSNWSPWTVFKSGAYRQFLAKGGMVGYVGDSLGVGTAPYLKGRVGKLVAKVLEGRQSPTGVGVLKGMLGDRFDRYVLDLGTNDPNAGMLSRSLKKADKLTGGRLLMVPTLNGPKAGSKNAALRGLADGDIDLFEWAKRSKGLVGPDGIHAETGGDYSKRAAMLAGALKAATRKHDRKVPKGAAKLSGSLTHKLRQTLGSKKPKTVDKLVRQIKKLGLPKKWMDQIARYGKDHERFSDFANSAQLISPDDGPGAVINGLNETGWLTKDLEAQFKMRNLLVKARDFVVRRRDSVDRAFTLAKTRLDDLAKPARVPRGWKGINPATGPVKKWNEQPAAKRKARMREWKHKHGRLPGDRDFDQRTGKVDEVADSRRKALRKLVPALQTQKSKLEAGRVRIVGEDGGLKELQGFGPEGILRSPWPIGTIFGGSILDTQHSLQALGAKPDVTDSATAEADTRRADILAELLREANLRTAVSERQFDVLRNFPPFGGQFATGGVVPGPQGAPRTIVAHGGETITPPGQESNLRVVIEDHRVRVYKDDVEQVVKQVTRKQARSGARVLPGQGGGRLR